MDNNDQIFYPQNDWLLNKQDGDLYNTENSEDIKDIFDLVNTDLLLNHSDIQDLFSNGAFYDGNDHHLFQHINQQNDNLYMNNDHFINMKQENLNYDINDCHNYTKQDFIINTDNFVEKPIQNYTEPQLSKPLNQLVDIDDKSVQQKKLMEQLLQRFQQDSSSAELILQLLELAKSTGNNTANQEVNTPAIKKQVIEVKPQIDHSQQLLAESNRSIKTKMIKIEKRSTPKKIELQAKPVQTKSQVILKNISVAPTTQSSPPKIILQQISSATVQASPQQPQQYFITTTNNCKTGCAPVISHTSKNLTVEDLQKMLLIKNSQQGVDSNVQQPDANQDNENLLTNRTIVTTVPFQVLERNDKIPITRLQTSPQIFRGERKSTHNAIEKKYRMSINNRLEELKELLDGADSKLNKSSILRKAIDHIRYLRNSNHRLNEEVKYLKSLIGQKHIDTEMIIPHMETDFLIEYNDTTTPESSHLDCHSYSSDDGFPSSPENTIDDSMFLSHGIDPHLVSPYMNKSQFLLSFFFIIMFVINPIGLLMDSSLFSIPGFGGQIAQGSSSFGQRNLQSVNEDITHGNPTSVWLRWITLWIVNLIFTLLIFARVTMFSEPIFKPILEIAANFWRAHAQADVSIERGDFEEGEKQLLSCLGILGRTKHKSGLQIFVSLMWNLLRQFLHRMHIGGWLESKAGDQVWRRTDSVNNVKKSASMATLVYLKLLRMHVIKYPTGSRLYAMNLALSTINMAEASGEVLPQTLLAEAYVLLALTMRMILPDFLHSYIQFTLHQTISELRLSPELSWLHTTEGLNFLFSRPFQSEDFNSFYSNTPKKQGNALACMTRLYMEYLQEKTLGSMIMAFGLPIDEYREAMIELKKYTSLLQTCSQNLHSEKKGEVDETVQWWCSSLSMVILLPDEYQKMSYKKIDFPPKELSKFPLALCISKILKIKEILSNEAVDTDSIKKLCEDASLLLKQSFAFKDDSYTRKCITESWQLLACDWLLTFLTDLVQKDDFDHGSWQCNIISTTSNRKFVYSQNDLLVFESLLAIFRKLSLHLKVGQSKLSFHEAALRLMAGANPVKTMQMFERNLRQRSVTKDKHGNDEGGVGMSREEASSVLLWIRSLPKQMLDTHQSSSLLHAAILSFERLGDSRSASICRNIMLRTNI